MAPPADMYPPSIFGDVCCANCWPGECQEVLVAGELMGVVSNLRPPGPVTGGGALYVGVETPMPVMGPPFGSMSAALGFLSRWRQYFLTTLTIPSFVKGFANVSFMPAEQLVKGPRES